MATTTAFIISSNSRAPQHCDVCSIKQKHTRNTFKSHQISQTARLQLPWLPLKSGECEALRLDRDDNRGIVTISQSTNRRILRSEAQEFLLAEKLDYQGLHNSKGRFGFFMDSSLGNNSDQGSSCLKMRRLV